ncbi:MAG: four helix bundle protein [Tepidisphaeraceae bacterium]|jgi:four helix bundle protein
MTNDESNSKQLDARASVFDLEERTASFGERVIRFCKRVPPGPVTTTLITQLVKAATSVGANYCEANDAESKADFCHKIGICRKESKESKHFLRMLVAAEPSLRADAAELWKEAKQLNLIFSKIVHSARSAVRSKPTGHSNIRH